LETNGDRTVEIDEKLISVKPKVITRMIWGGVILVGIGFLFREIGVSGNIPLVLRIAGWSFLFTTFVFAWFGTEDEYNEGFLGMVWSIITGRKHK